MREYDQANEHCDLPTISSWEYDSSNVSAQQNSNFTSLNFLFGINFAQINRGTTMVLNQKLCSANMLRIQRVENGKL